MSKVKIKLNSAGVRELLKSDEIRKAVETAAGSVARNAGADYATRTHTSNQRTIVNVYPNTAEAARENAKNNTLIKALR